MNDFRFSEMERIEGPELDLMVSKLCPANPQKGYVPAYRLRIMLHGTDTEVGLCDLRIGHNDNTYYGGNIGYGVYEEYRGNHYAAKACMLLKDLALEHGFDYLVITCDPGNIASRKTCEYLGSKLDGIFKLPEWTEMYKMGKRMKCRYIWHL